MPGPLRKQDAKRIIKKLAAVNITEPNSPHDIWAVITGA